MIGIIEIQTKKGTVKTRAIVYGDFAIHVENAVVDKKTRKPLFALTHVPTGMQVDGHYKNPLPLRASLRFLALQKWPKLAHEITSDLKCQLDAIQARELGERGSHWAHRRNFSKRKAEIAALLEQDKELNSQPVIRECYSCPSGDCGLTQHSNGLIAWCEAGHVYKIEAVDSRYNLE